MHYGTNKLKLWLFIWLALPIAIESDEYMEENGVTLRLESTKCKCAPTMCSVTCNVKSISRERANANGLLKLFKPLNFIEYHVKTYYKHSNNEYRPMLVVLRDEFCKTYANRSPLNMLGILMTALGNTTNINQPCPWNPGDYYIKDFNLSIKHWPFSFIPEGRHMLNITLYSEPNVFLLNYKVYFEAINHGILDMRVG